MRKPKLASLGIVVRDRATQEASDTIYCDNLISVRADEFGSTVPPFVRHSGRKALFDSVSALNYSSKNLDLGPALEEVIERLSPDCSIELEGFHITHAVFDRIIQHFTSADFRGCAFHKGWWEVDRELAMCASVSFTYCAFALPRKVKASMAVWSALSRLGLDDGFDDSFSHGPNRMVPNRLRGRAADVGTAFVGPALRSLRLSQLASLSILNELADDLKLTDLEIAWTSITPKAFEWVSGQKGLRNLWLSWGPESNFDLSLLLRLRRLHYLSLDTDYLDDDGFDIIAKHPTIRSLRIERCHRLTALSWNSVLSMASLRHIVFTNNIVHDPLPTGLPETTRLRTAYGINVSESKMVELEAGLARYPELRVSWEFQDREERAVHWGHTSDIVQ